MRGIENLFIVAMEKKEKGEGRSNYALIINKDNNSLNR